MITVFDMETGAIAAQSASKASPSQAMTDPRVTSGIVALALQPVPTERSGSLVTPGPVVLQAAEVLARFG